MGPADHAAKYTYFGLEHLPWAKWASSPLSHILQSGGYPSIGSTGPPNAIDHLEHWSSLEKDADKQKRYIDAASILIAAVTPPCNWKTYLSAVATSPNLARHNLAPSAAPPARADPGQKKRARPSTPDDERFAEFEAQEAQEAKEALAAKEDQKNAEIRAAKEKIIRAVMCTACDRQWVIEVAKDKKKSKDTCKSCSKIIEGGQILFKWCPFSGGMMLYDSECAVRTHEVSPSTIKRKCGLTSTQVTELHQLMESTSVNSADKENQHHPLEAAKENDAENIHLHPPKARECIIGPHIFKNRWGTPSVGALATTSLHSLWAELWVTLARSSLLRCSD